MGKKDKKGGKRMSKKQLAAGLEQYFVSQQGKAVTLKDIFRSLHLNTHPLKMLAMDIMEEMAWDDFITKVGDNSYQLNTKGQVQESSSASRTARTRSCQTAATSPSSWPSATPCQP